MLRRTTAALINMVHSHFILMLSGFCIEGFNNFGKAAESFQVSDVKDLIKDMVVSGQLGNCKTRCQCIPH